MYFILASLTFFTTPVVAALNSPVPMGVGNSAATAASTSGVAIVEVITDPDIGSDTLRFVGTPAGLLSLRLGQADKLVATDVVPGSHKSTLTVIGPSLLAHGYSLVSIACDDQNSTSPSVGDVATQTATFNIEDGETVTCQFKLSVAPCLCPREGSWTVSHLPGSMTCTGALNMAFPLLAASTDTGTLEMRDGCQTIFATDFSEETADTTMHRVAGCGYEGVVGGEEGGIPMQIHFTWDVQNEEFITGILYSQVNEQGAICTVSRGFELRFEE